MGSNPVEITRIQVWLSLQIISESIPKNSESIPRMVESINPLENLAFP